MIFQTLLWNLVRGKKREISNFSFHQMKLRCHYQAPISLWRRRICLQTNMSHFGTQIRQKILKVQYSDQILRLQRTLLSNKKGAGFFLKMSFGALLALWNPVFLYRGCVDFRQCTSYDLKQAAEFLDIPDLYHFVVNRIKSSRNLSQVGLETSILKPIQLRGLGEVCLNEGLLADVTIKLDDGVLTAHKALLMARF